MNILFLQDDFPPYAKGGAGIVAHTLARALVRRKHTVTVITAVGNRAHTGTFYEDGIRVERIYSNYTERWRGWRSLYNPTTVSTVSRLLREIKPDVVHAHNIHYHLSYWTLHQAHRSGAKVFLTAHDAMLVHYGKLFKNKKGNYVLSAWQQWCEYRFRYNPFRNIFIKILLKNVHKIFAVSNALQSALQENGIHNIAMIHNGIAVEAWDVQVQQVDVYIKKNHLEQKRIVLFGGRISASKGGNVILQAMRHVIHKEPSATLVLLGASTAYSNQLIQQAAAWGMKENVVSMGWLSGDELTTIYAAASVVVVPSLYLDPLPTVVLEAMASRKPVVGTCWGGTPEMVKNGETGFIIDPNDIHAFSVALEKILADQKLQHTLGIAGYKRVKNLFSLDDWVQRTEKVYTAFYE